MPLGGYTEALAEQVGRIVSRKQLENRWVLSFDLKIEKESQFNTAGGSEFQVRRAAV